MKTVPLMTLSPYRHVDVYLDGKLLDLDSLTITFRREEVDSLTINFRREEDGEEITTVDIRTKR